MENNNTKKQYFWNFVFMILYLALVAGAIFIFRAQGKIVTRISVFDLILLALATYRLTHLIVYDYVFNFLRDYVGRFERGPLKTVADLISCPWCTGIWAAFVLSFLYFLTPYAWFFIFVIALAGAAIFFRAVVDLIMRK